LRHRLFHLMMKALGLITLLIDFIVFSQDDVGMPAGYHHPDDIFLRHWELILLWGIFQNREHIICSEFQPIRIHSSIIDIEVDVKMAHLFFLYFIQGWVFLLQLLLLQLCRARKILLIWYRAHQEIGYLPYLMQCQL